MTLLALLLALGLERAAQRLLHLREPLWFDRYYRWLGPLGARSGTLLGGQVVLAALLPVLPVALVGVGLDAWTDLLWVPFAAVVLVASLGPRDLFDEAREYVDAEERGDWERARRLAAELIEQDAAQRRSLRATAVEDALFVQANNRLAGVVFWFLVAGPAGAWLFRVSDLLRRAAIADCASGTGADAALQVAKAFQLLHALLAWIPARLLALSYAVAGSFEDARGDWRDIYRALPDSFTENSDRLLVAVGHGALGEASKTPGAGPAVAALRLIRRASLAWLTVISLLTLVAWVA